MDLTRNAVDLHKLLYVPSTMYAQLFHLRM
jgi:hypothetical protein